MKEEKLFEAMNGIDEQFILEAGTFKKKRRAARIVANAACLCLAGAVTIALLARRNPASGALDPEIAASNPPSDLEMIVASNDSPKNDRFSGCDGYEDWLKSTFTFRGESYSSATSDTLESCGLIDENGNYTISPKDNLGENLGLSENTAFLDMNGLEIYALKSGNGDLCVVEFPGKVSVYEYYQRLVRSL